MDEWMKRKSLWKNGETWPRKKTREGNEKEWDQKWKREVAIQEERVRQTSTWGIGI